MDLPVVELQPFQLVFTKINNLPYNLEQVYRLNETEEKVNAARKELWFEGLVKMTETYLSNGLRDHFLAIPGSPIHVLDVSIAWIGEPPLSTGKDRNNSNWSSSTATYVGQARVTLTRDSVVPSDLLFQRIVAQAFAPDLDMTIYKAFLQWQALQRPVPSENSVPLVPQFEGVAFSWCNPPK